MSTHDQRDAAESAARPSTSPKAAPAPTSASDGLPDGGLPDGGRPDGELTDLPGARSVAAHRTVYDGMVWSIARDTIDFAPGVRFDREYVQHTGAVAILAFDPEHRAILVRQYRHPASTTFWEIPAGLLDHQGEDQAAAAARELAEETGYRAGSIEHLLDFFPSPGGSSEMIRLYVGYDCTPDADVDFQREDEEAEIVVARVPFADLYSAAIEGRLTNGTLLMAVLAYGARRENA